MELRVTFYVRFFWNDWLWIRIRSSFAALQKDQRLFAFAWYLRL